MQQKRPDRALAVAERMKTQFPDRISGDTLLGIAYLSTRDIDKAHEAFARAVAREPEDPAAAGNLVNILVIEGKTEEARAVHARVLEADPAHLNTLLTAADLAARAGDNARADAERESAVAGKGVCVRADLGGVPEIKKRK